MPASGADMISSSTVAELSTRSTSLERSCANAAPLRRRRVNNPAIFFIGSEPRIGCKRDFVANACSSSGNLTRSYAEWNPKKEQELWKCRLLFENVHSGGGLS